MRAIAKISVLLIVLLLSCNQQDNLNKAIEQEKIITKNIDAFTNVFFNEKDSSQLNNILTDDFVRYMNGIEVASNIEEFKASMKVIFKGFPDLKIENQIKIVKDNHAFVQWDLTGVNTGNYGENPPTGKKVKISGLSHLYFNEEGKMYKQDVYYNELNLLQQLGYTFTQPIVE